MSYTLSLEEKTELDKLHSQKKVLLGKLCSVCDKIINLECLPRKRFEEARINLRSQHMPTYPFYKPEQMQNYERALKELGKK
jgi:hypothetical protein